MHGCAAVGTKTWLAKTRAHAKQDLPGATMKPHLQSKAKASPYKSSSYSAPLCVLMLLLAGMLVKFGPAIQLFHVQN
jgi:hypothetical protein